MNNLQAEYNSNVDFITAVVEDRELNNKIRMTDDKRFLVTLENAYNDVTAGKEIKCMSDGDIELCVVALKESVYEWDKKVKKDVSIVGMIEAVEEANRREKNFSPTKIYTRENKMMKQLIEVKAYTNGLRWEDTPAKIVEVYGETDEEIRENAYDVVKQMSEEEKNEFRYNFVGGIQGHYVGSMYKLNRYS